MKTMVNGQAIEGINERHHLELCMAHEGSVPCVCVVWEERDLVEVFDDESRRLIGFRNWSAYVDCPECNGDGATHCLDTRSQSGGE